MTNVLAATSTNLHLTVEHMLHGANRWCRRPVLEVTVVEPYPLAVAEANRLLSALKLEPVVVEPLDRPGLASRWIAAAALRLQNALGASVSFATAVPWDGGT